MKVLPTQSDIAVAQNTDFRTDEATTASFKSALAQAATTETTAPGTDVTTPGTDEAVPAGIKLLRAPAL